MCASLFLVARDEQSFQHVAEDRPALVVVGYVFLIALERNVYAYSEGQWDVCEGQRHQLPPPKVHWTLYHNDALFASCTQNGDVLAKPYARMDYVASELGELDHVAFKVSVFRVVEFKADVDFTSSLLDSCQKVLDGDLSGHVECDLSFHAMKAHVGQVPFVWIHCPEWCFVYYFIVALSAHTLT